MDGGFFRFLLFALMVPVFFWGGGCATSGPDLTAEERQALTDYARAVISRMPAKKVSDADKQFVMKNPPSIAITYEGHKRGRYRLTWQAPRGKDAGYLRAITYRGAGDMLDFRGSFQGIILNDEPDERQSRAFERQDAPR